MNVALVGSRNYKNLDRISDVLATLEPGTTVISGGARGVDTEAIARAYRLGFRTIEIRAQWVRDDGTADSQAGKRRNSQLVEMADEVYAFWDGKSGGTWDTILKARNAGKLKTVIPDD